jgi:hypothetical protein
VLPREIERVSHDIVAGLYRREPTPPDFQRYGRLYVRPQTMANVWNSPMYQLVSKAGKRITVDVTFSVSAGLPANKLFDDTLIKFFRSKGVESVVDFGAGALRHTFPLIRAGFQVCAVEFEQEFSRPVCAEALRKAEKHPNFCKLIWPCDFKKSGCRSLT